MDGVKRMCSIRGKLRNRVWINAGDLILVSLRDIGDVCDVIHKFYPEEAFELQDLGEIPENITINEGMPDEEQQEDNDLIIGAGDGSDEEGGGANDDLDIDDI